MLPVDEECLFVIARELQKYDWLCAVVASHGSA